ncbi:hypothetical protein DFH07DRAFT_793911 [Mycena maculata]|uniref:Uncharacterized protein n=1 Tax=Mycena maculata TaxID=230809 RepID=A0AAD7NXR8_9AGAR|nr:hypothetical protein DFH07DRAFT_793911 [Mycena maculata]
MYKANKTSAYLPTLSAEDRQAIRAQVRLDDGSGANREQKHAQIKYMKEVVDNNKRRDNERKERVEKTKQVLANTTAIASPQDLDTAFQIGRGMKGYLSMAALDLQLDWHIANAVKESPNSQETSAFGIPKAKTGANGRGNRENRYTYLREAISKRANILERIAAAPGKVVDEAPGEEVFPSPMEVDDDGEYSEDDYYER